MTEPAKERVKHSAVYEEHLLGPRWRAMKARLMTIRGRQCERCGYIGHLQLHHRSYRRLGHEWDEDLELLCPPCHDKADRERKERR